MRIWFIADIILARCCVERVLPVVLLRLTPVPASQTLWHRDRDAGQKIKLDLTMQTMYVRHNIEARSRSNCCRGKSVLHISVCARVLACARARGRVHARACMWTCLSSMQFVCAMLSLNLWLLWLHSIFPHYLTSDTIFGKMLLNIKSVFSFWHKCGDVFM